MCVSPWVWTVRLVLVQCFGEVGGGESRRLFVGGGVDRWAVGRWRWRRWPSGVGGFEIASAPRACPGLAVGWGRFWSVGDVLNGVGGKDDFLLRGLRAVPVALPGAPFLGLASVPGIRNFLLVVDELVLRCIRRNPLWGASSVSF